MSLEALAEQAETIGADLEAGEGLEGAAPAAPLITNAQAFAGAMGAAREAFCFFTKLESPRVVLTDDKVSQLGALWGPVLDKHGINLGDVMGDYALEFTAVIGTISVVGELRQAVTLEIAARSIKAKAEEKPANDEQGSNGDGI